MKVNITSVPNTSEYEYFQRYSHDNYLGEKVSNRFIIPVAYETSPMGQTLTDYFQRKYGRLYRLL